MKRMTIFAIRFSSINIVISTVNDIVYLIAINRINITNLIIILDAITININDMTVIVNDIIAITIANILTIAVEAKIRT